MARHGELADGAELLRWLAEHDLPGPGLSWRERPERLAWIVVMTAASHESVNIALELAYHTDAHKIRFVRVDNPQARGATGAG